MDAIRTEIDSLAAETIVLQTLFGELCHGLIVRDAAFSQIISRVFDQTADHIEDMAIKFGKSSSPEHLVKALRIVEEMRTVVFSGTKKP